MISLSWIEFDRAYYEKSMCYPYEGNMEAIWRRRIQIHKAGVIRSAL